MCCKISVIMGIYNCEKTLDEAICSILQQTYHNWELIMCDDDSTDNTYLVAQKYADRYDNIYLYKNEKNMGLNYTLNHCLQHASGEYIARMDGDDVSILDRFEKQLHFLETHKEYAIVSSPMIYFDDQGDFGVGVGGGEPAIKSIPLNTPFSHAPAMVRKEAYDKVHGYTVEDHFLRVEDWHLWVKMYAAGYKGFNLDEPLYKMRDDSNAISRRKFKYRFNEARVSRYSVKALHLPKWMYIYSLRPIIVGLLPRFLYEHLHKMKLNSKRSMK